MYLVSEQIALPEDANEVILYEFLGLFIVTIAFPLL